MKILEKEIEGRPGKQTVKVTLDIMRSVRRSFMEDAVDEDGNTVSTKQWHYVTILKVIDIKCDDTLSDEEILTIAEKFNIEMVEPVMPNTLEGSSHAALVAEVEKRLSVSDVIMLEGKLIVAPISITPIIIDPIIKEGK